MLLGESVPGDGPWITNWRFVEQDLHDITTRVQEYDSEARLIRDSTDGQLGLARLMPSYFHIQGGYWTIAIQFHDMETGEPITHADGRILDIMGRFDGHKIKMADHRARMRQREMLDEQRSDNELSDVNGDHAERMVHAMRKDVVARPRAFVPEKVPA